MTGEIMTVASLDYESLATEYNFTVKGEASAQRPGMQPLTVSNEIIVMIRVINLNDTPHSFSQMRYT